MSGRAVLAAWLAASVALAAPAPDAPAPSSPAADAEAERLARQLVGVVNQIETQYVRPIGAEELLHAALAGLYDAARRPAPPRLREAVKKACAARPDPFNALNREDNEITPLNEGSALPVIQRAFQDVAGADALQGRNPLLVCCSAMASILDPHSGVLTAAEYRRNAAPEESVEGLGLDLEPYGGVGPLQVGVVVPGSPAQRSGLRPGDRITHVNDKAIDDYPTGQAAIEALLGARRNAQRDEIDGPLVIPPQSVAVRYHRPGSDKVHKVELVTQRFRPESVFGVRRLADNSWDYWLDRKAGLAQVRLGSLGVGAADELRDVLLRLESDGLRGLVLDLRACPGGFLREALACAGQFVGDVPIATVRSRGQPEAVHRGAGEGKFLVLPLVVLVNGDTSGGGELIAAALKDHGRAVIVGQRTRGKASVQTPIHLGLEGVGMKLTSGTFLRPSGKNLHRFPESKPTDDWGVLPEPAYAIRVSPEFTQSLRDWWLLQTLRPGDSSERLPLDDPTNDPLRALAARALVEQMALPRPAPAAR